MHMFRKNMQKEIERVCLQWKSNLRHVLCKIREDEQRQSAASAAILDGARFRPFFYDRIVSNAKRQKEFFVCSDKKK